MLIITQADKGDARPRRGSRAPARPLYGVTPAFAVPHDLGFRLVQRWQFNLVQVIQGRAVNRYQTRDVVDKHLAREGPRVDSLLRRHRPRA